MTVYSHSSCKQRIDFASTDVSRAGSGFDKSCTFWPCTNGQVLLIASYFGNPKHQGNTTLPELPARARERSPWPGLWWVVRREDQLTMYHIFPYISLWGLIDMSRILLDLVIPPQSHLALSPLCWNGYHRIVGALAHEPVLRYI